jgi:hypothetical protein
MEPIDKEKKEQHIGGFTPFDIGRYGRYNTSLISRKVKINPKSTVFTRELPEKHIILNKVFRIFFTPLFHNQFTNKSTKKWASLDLSKFGSWRSVTDNYEGRGDFRIWTNEVNLPVFSSIINDFQIQSKITPFKNKMQNQKRKQKYLIESKSVQNKVFQTSLSPLSYKQFIGTLTKNRKQKSGSQIQTNGVDVPIFSHLINDPRIQSETDIIKDQVQTQKSKKGYLKENEVIDYQRLDSETDKKKENLEKKAEQSSYFYLDSSLKDFLAGILNMRIPSVKIYANQASDTLTKQFNADALTYKNNIFFKTGKYNPRDKKGIALLGHELTHAAQTEIQDQNLAESKITDYLHEEQEAIGNEKSLLRYFRSIEANDINKNFSNLNFGDNHSRDYGFNSEAIRNLKSSASPDSFLGNSTSTSKYHNKNQTSRTALTSRDLSLPSETNLNSNLTFQLSDQQLRSIKDDIYRDIMNRIKIEFERGG